MMSLFLPTSWVFVWFEDGHVKNVANSDTLTAGEAKDYKAAWEKSRGKKIVRVTLETSDGNILKSFTY